MRKKISLLILAIIIILSITIVYGANFSDMSGHWAESVVSKMADKGILNGFEDGTFKPNESVTREQFAKILVESLNLENDRVTKEFKDVDDNRWSKNYIDIASRYLNSYWESGKEHFKPTEASVREDVAVAVVRACGLENDVADANILNQFADENEISEYNKQYIAIAVKHGIMQGKGENFDPKGNLTRAEVSQLMYNVTNKIENGGFKPLVATSYKELIDTKNNYTYTFSIPYITINSKDAKKINDELESVYDSYIEDIKKYKIESEDGMDWYYYHIANVNDDILTVALINYCYGASIMSVYNIDINTGATINNEEILKLTNNEYLAKVDLVEIYDEIFAQMWIEPYLKDEFRKNKDFIKNEKYKLYGCTDSAYEEYLSDYIGKTLNDIKWYLGEEKNIYAQFSYISPAGSTDGRYTSTFNVTKYIKEKGNNYYFIENSDKVVVDADTWDYDLECRLLDSLSNEELNIAYNEIFARHGHDFKTQSLKEHFNSMLWYKPVTDKTVSLEELNEIERQNAMTIKSEIEKRKKLLNEFLEEQKIMYGDANEDGEFTQEDLTLLINYIETPNKEGYFISEKAKEACNVCLDDELDEYDYTALVCKFVFEWDEELPYNKEKLLNDMLEYDYIYGDINLNGKITVNDIKFLKKYISKLEIVISNLGFHGIEKIEKNSDLDLNGIIDEDDVIILQAYIDGKIKELPHSHTYKKGKCACGIVE